MCYARFMPTTWLKELDSGKCTCNAQPKEPVLLDLGEGEKCPHCQLKEREDDVEVPKPIE